MAKTIMIIAEKEYDVLEDRMRREILWQADDEIVHKRPVAKAVWAAKSSYAVAAKRGRMVEIRTISTEICYKKFFQARRIFRNVECEGCKL